MQTHGWACSFGHSLLRQGFQFRPFKQTPSIFSLQSKPWPLPLAPSLPLSPTQGFISSLSLAMPLPSPTQNIQGSLRKMKHDKWGWVIYRCTYGDNEAWTLFKKIINQHSREIIADGDTPEAGDSLEWTFVEDRGTLDGASREQLRARFKAWAGEAIRTEQPQAENDQTFGIPRYNFFIQVD